MKLKLKISKAGFKLDAPGLLVKDCRYGILTVLERWRCTRKGIITKAKMEGLPEGIFKIDNPPKEPERVRKTSS